MLEYLPQAVIRCLKYTIKKVEQYTRNHERVLGKKSEEQAAQCITENVRILIRALAQHATYYSPHAQSRLYRFAGRISDLSSNLGNWPTGPSGRLDCPEHRLA